MKIDPYKELEEWYEKKLNESNKKQQENLKGLENAKGELSQANAQLEAQKDYEAIKTERDQWENKAKQKTQELQVVAEKLGLNEQATLEQVNEKLSKLSVSAEEDKSAVKRYLTEYTKLLRQRIESFEDLETKNGEKKEEYQMERENLKAEIEEVSKFITK